MKRKLTSAALLAIVLAVLLVGTACALFSSQVAEFFGQHWNQELGERLQEGKIAQIGETVTVGNVSVTLDEVVYRSRGLYGVGTVRPVDERDVLVPFDMTVDGEGEFALNEEAQVLARRAEDNGGRLLTMETAPMQIGVDGGTMLTPGTIGYFDIANADGSLTFSFEASDGFAVNEGTTYQLLMRSTVLQLESSGAPIEGSQQSLNWMVDCTPVQQVQREEAETAVTAPLSLEEDYAVVVPEAYKENGTLPICQAIELDFTQTVDPAWFNQSGILSQEDNVDFRFRDNASLFLAPEALFYGEYADENNTPAASAMIVRLAWVREWEEQKGKWPLEQTELTGITLKEAQAQAEELIHTLGIDSNQYRCQDALDMSLQRIQAMAKVWDEAIESGQLMVGGDEASFDYSSIPASEEGYYLCYTPLGMDSIGSTHMVTLYVTGRGIVYASIRNQYVQGEIVSTPDALLSPGAAVSRLYEELARSGNGGEVKAVQEAVLTWAVVRSGSKEGGMVFAPVWEVLYQDESALRNGFSCYALFHAVDGTLIDATFH